METFVKGDIVVLRFPFSDLSSAKKRPAFVAAKPQDDEFILCQITSQARIDNYSIALANSDFSSGNLNMTSLVNRKRYSQQTNHL